MTLAHVNKIYLESNIMASSPSSHLNSLYAELQVHALSVSDGLAKVLTALGSDSVTTVMGRIDIDLTTATRQQSTTAWLQADAGYLEGSTAERICQQRSTRYCF